MTDIRNIYGLISIDVNVGYICTQHVKAGRERAKCRVKLGSGCSADKLSMNRAAPLFKSLREKLYVNNFCGV